jgi:hypothetical protein
VKKFFLLGSLFRKIFGPLQNSKITFTANEFGGTGGGNR